MISTTDLLQGASAAESYASRGDAASRSLLSWEDPGILARWQEAINAILGWLSSRNRDDPDRPTEAVLQAAIDFAVDQSSVGRGVAVPDNMTWSGGGRLAMEWYEGPRTMVIEFFAVGLAEFEKYESGTLTQRGILYRNPSSRRYELRGDRDDRSQLR